MLHKLQLDVWQGSKLLWMEAPQFCLSEAQSEELDETWSENLVAVSCPPAYKHWSSGRGWSRGSLTSCLTHSRLVWGTDISFHSVNSASNLKMDDLVRLSVVCNMLLQCDWSYWQTWIFVYIFLTRAMCGHYYPKQAKSFVCLVFQSGLQSILCPSLHWSHSMADQLSPYGLHFVAHIQMCELSSQNW